MSLNIKNPRVHDLAREAARVSGRSQTSAIEEALVMYLRDHGEDPAQTERAVRRERMLAMGARFRREERTPDRGIVRVEDLYDDATGMPR